MVLFNRGYSFRSRGATGGGRAQDLTGYATRAYVDAAILATESDTDAVKQDVVEIKNTANIIQTQVNENTINSILLKREIGGITDRAVFTDGNGRINGANGSSTIDQLVSKRGMLTLVPNNLFRPSARILNEVATMEEVVVEEEVVEPELLEGKVEASGTGVPADGYAFYRYDDSNVNDGLNSRVEIEMPKNTN